MMQLTSSALCTRWVFPSTPPLLHLQLFTRTSHELSNLVRDLLDNLNLHLLPPPATPTSPITFSCSNDLPNTAPHHVWVVQWDGSHMPCGASIGLTIHQQNCPPTITASVPIHARDATHTK